MQKLFSKRVYKVSVDANFSCPNRDGTKSEKGCIFCDSLGSSSRTQKISTPIRDQVIRNIAVRKKRYRAKKFIVYFQSFSNTYAEIDILKKRYDEALYADKDIIGISISTRADCIDRDKIKLIASYKKKFPYVCLEYGMQSSHNKTLQRINRCETFKDFLSAISLSKKYEIDTCAHVIIGLPGEDENMVLETAKRLAKIKVDGVKIHFLVAMRNTELEKLYIKNLWSPLSLKENISLACSFIEHLPGNFIIHRVSKSGHPNEIAAPLWMREKNIDITSLIKKEFEKRKTHQGIFYS